MCRSLKGRVGSTFAPTIPEWISHTARFCNFAELRPSFETGLAQQKNETQ